MHAIRVSILGFMLIGLFSGCTSVSLESRPSGAEVNEQGNIVGTTPYPTKKIAFVFGRRTYKLAKDGYSTKIVTVKASDAPAYTAQLERPKVRLTSEPAGAQVVDLDTNEDLGLTPVTISIVRDSQRYRLSKLSYYPAEIELTPQSDETELVDLGQQIPGMVLRKVVVTRDGLAITDPEVVYSDEDVVESSPTVDSCQPLTVFGEAEQVGSLALSPDGKSIYMSVIQRTEDEQSAQQLYTSKLWTRPTRRDAREQQITDGLQIDENPCVSPDHKFLYFNSDSTGGSVVFRVSTDWKKKGQQPLTDKLTLDRYPDISPDGKVVLWTGYTPKTTLPHLWSQPVSKTDLPTQITDGERPKWSPDGSMILFSKLNKGTKKYELWTMLEDGNEPTRMLIDTTANVIDPEWSVDGKKILYACDSATTKVHGLPQYDIYIVNADGSSPVRLTTNGSRDDQPVMAPDGKTIYFRSNRGLSWNIWRMQLK